MLKALDVQLAIALIDFTIPVVRVHDIRRDAFLRLLFTLKAIKAVRVWCAEISVLIHAQDLQAFYHAGLQERAVRDTLCILQISRAVVHDQIISINRFGNGTIAQRAVVHLLERGAAEAKHQQHAVSVRVILGRHRRQVMVEVALQRICKLIFLQAGVVIVIANFHRPIGGQQLRPRISLEAQHCFKQQRVPHLGHAFDRRTVSSASKAGDFNLQAKKLQAGGAIFNPFAAALQIIADAAQQVFADAAQFHLWDLINEVIKPAGFFFATGRLQGLAINPHRDAAIGMLNGEDVSAVIGLRLIGGLIGLHDHNLFAGRQLRRLGGGLTNGRAKARDKWHGHSLSRAILHMWPRSRNRLDRI